MNDQNENPFGNPRFITTIVLVFLFLWGWQFYMNKYYPQATTPATVVQQNTDVKKLTNEEIATTSVENKQIQSAKNTQIIQQAEELNTEKTYSYEDENVKWTLSSFGMGLSSFEVKKFTDRNNKTILFESAEKLFSISSSGKKLNFQITAVNDVEFIGTTIIEGKTLKRTIRYKKELGSFESETEFEQGILNLSYYVNDKKHAPKSSSFFMPSFEKQDFLFREGDKIKTEGISGVKDEESVSKTFSNISLASIATQYFTESIIDKSEISPSASINVSGTNALLNLIYDLKDSQIKKISQIYYIGPKTTEALQKIDPLLPEVMDYGIFGFISKPLLMLMRFLHQLLGNWGLAIIALTVVVRLIMLPFSVLSFRSSRAMQKIQPQLQAVREKYKSDPMKVNRETMAIMKENKANPLSGCLPMLIQIPIFFALWRTIGSSIDIYQQPFFGWITDLSSHDHFFVLPVLMGITMFFQQKLTPTTMDATQAKILNFMPIIFAMFMLSLPSGLTLYNFISALFGVTQQYFLLKDNSKKKTA